MVKYLIIGDVDQIQSYVFASSRLRIIRGASALLENSIKEFVENEKAQQQVEFLRWRGGQVVAILAVTDEDQAQAQADEFCAHLEAAVRRKSGGAASITTTSVKYDGTSFRQHLKAAFRQIQAEKDGRQNWGIEGAALLTGPYYHRCDLLPTLPAQRREEIGDLGEEEERYLSAAASARLKEVRGKQKVDFDEQLLQKLDVQLAAAGYQFPYQPDDLWEQVEGGYLGFVAADGNSVGQMLEVIGNEQLYRNFSEEMYDLVLETIAQAARIAGIHKRKVHKTKQRRTGSGQQIYKYVPLVPVIVAGDDLSLLVRAPQALSLAAGLCTQFVQLSQIKSAIQAVVDDFCQDENYRVAAHQLFPAHFASGFNREATQAAGSSLTLSVGVAIAKRKFPISIFRRLAGELRNEAKRVLRERPEAVQEGGMIDFAVITSANVQSLQDLRERYRTDPDTRLTMRPYTLNKFKLLQSLAVALKSVPRSKRKLLYTECFAGREVGEAAYRFVLAREGKPVRDRIRQAMAALLGVDSDQAFHPNNSGKMETPLVDALELAELTEEEE